jgi:hypothetical protein
MRDLLIRCSSIGKLMTEPKSKSEVLSVGAKTHIRELVAQDIFSVEFEISDKKIEKGHIVEPDIIDLLNRVRGLQLVKNTERRNNGWITGECDLYHAAAREGYDAKAAWSVATFPLCFEDIAPAQATLYEWQFRGYMWLWDAERWHGAYGLVDTPEHLCRYEPELMHKVSHIEEHLRLTTWTVHRDRTLEAKMIEKVKAARDYYREVLADFDRTHKPLASAA